MDLKITKANNGFILTWSNEWDDGTKYTMNRVVEFKPNFSQLKAEDDPYIQLLPDLMFEIAEILEISHSKHNSLRCEFKLIDQVTGRKFKTR